MRISSSRRMIRQIAINNKMVKQQIHVTELQLANPTKNLYNRLFNKTAQISVHG